MQQKLSLSTQIYRFLSDSPSAVHLLSPAYCTEIRGSFYVKKIFQKSARQFDPTPDVNMQADTTNSRAVQRSVLH